MVRQLHEYGVCERFPTEALEFPGIIVSDDTRWAPTSLASAWMRYGRQSPPDSKTTAPIRDRGSPSDCVAKGEHDTL